jgi:hypothetical protein
MRTSATAIHIFVYIVEFSQCTLSKNYNMMDMGYMMFFYGSVAKRLELYPMYLYFLVGCQFLMLYQIDKNVRDICVTYINH